MEFKLLTDFPEVRASIDKLTAAIEAQTTVIAANTEAIAKSQEVANTTGPRRTRATKKEEPVELTPPQEERHDPLTSNPKLGESPVPIDIPVAVDTPIVSEVATFVPPVKLTIVDVRRRANEIYTAGDEKIRRNLYALNQRYGIQTLDNLPENRYQDYMEDLDVAYIKDFSASNDPHEPKFPF